MTYYTVTAEVEVGAAAEWLAWMRKTHIPEVLATGCFHACRITVLQDPAPPPGFATYLLEYEAPSAQAVARYRAEFAPALQQAHGRRFGSVVRATRTVRTMVT